MTKMQQRCLTKQEFEGLFELLPEYLFNEKNQPIVGALGISPYGYVGLIKLFEKIYDKKPKTNYKELLEKLCQKPKKNKK